MTESTGDSYQVKVNGMRFDAAHMATFAGMSEPLHGHSYEVTATLSGTLTTEAWVFDFIALKSLIRRLCDDLDHRFLLQRDSGLLKIERQEKYWQITTPRGARYVLPAHDVYLLPVDNTTAERLAQWFCSHIWQEIRLAPASNIDSVTVEVSEGPGQSASHRMKRLP